MLLTRLSMMTAVFVGLVALAPARTAHPPARAADDPAKEGKAGGVTLLRVPEKGIQPQAVVDAKGVVHLVYFRGEPGGGDVFYVRSEDGGDHFSRPLRVNSQPGSVIA